MSRVIGMRELYSSLKKRSDARSTKPAVIEILTRLREGIKDPHAQIILGLYWWHLFLTDRPLYLRLKTATDEASMRQILSGKVMTSCVQGEKTITVCSDMFPPDFFEIIDAYLEYTDEMAAAKS